MLKPRMTRTLWVRRKILKKETFQKNAATIRQTKDHEMTHKRTRNYDSCDPHLSKIEATQTPPKTYEQWKTNAPNIQNDPRPNHVPIQQPSRRIKHDPSYEKNLGGRGVGHNHSSPPQKPTEQSILHHSSNKPHPEVLTNAFRFLR